MVKLPFNDLQNLPECAAYFIQLVIRKMRYRKKVRADVMAELIAHFEDELAGCGTAEEKDKKAQQLIDEFGNAKLLAKLCRRAKKRCRSLWRTVTARGFQVIGFIVLYIIVRAIFLLIGTPNISVNYIDWLNRLVAVEQAESENARPFYDWAAELSSKSPPEILKKVSVCTSKGYETNDWFADFNDNEKESLVTWLNDSRQSLETLKEGSKKPYCWQIYETKKSDPIRDTLILDVAKPLSKYREVARAMRCQIIYDASRGKVSEAMDNCLVLQRFGMHLQGKGLIIEQLVGVAIEAMAHDITFKVLDGLDIPVDILRDFHGRLESNLSNAGPSIVWEAEKAFWYDIIQRGFTDDGKGGGRVLRDGLPFVIKDAPSSLAGFFFWNFPDRRQVVKTIDNYFEQVTELLSQTPYQLHTKGESQVWDELGKEIYMLQMLGPAHGRISLLSWRLKTNRRALLTVVAVLRYEKERGEYPESLEELVSAGYLKTMPIDPFSDKPLKYKKTDDGFTLYSFGENLKDDKGVASRNDDGRIKKFAEEGDWVFWPVGG